MDSYVAIDLETTGVNPHEDKIIEVGMIRVEDNVITEYYETYINPQIRIPEIVTGITGIRDEDVKMALPINEKIQEILDFIGDSVLLGHNVAFDYKFIKKAAINNKLEFNNKTIDTLKIAREVLKSLPKKNLEYLCEYFGINDGKSHRAMYDAVKAHEIYGILKRENFDKTEAYLPVNIDFKAKKDVPITKSQNEYLKNLLKYHKIEEEVQIDSLTKSQASRMIDNILSVYGRIL